MRAILFAVFVAVAAATAAVLSQLSFGGSEKTQIAGGTVSALSRAQRASDALPAGVLAYPFAERNFASPRGSGSRLLMTEGSLRLFAVPGKDRMLCLIEIDDGAETAGGACADRKVLLTGSIYMAARQENGSWNVVGLVGDGPTYAEADDKRAAVRNNAFVLNGVRAGKVTIGSPAASQTIDVFDD
jgi:hypothetical protein